MITAPHPHSEASARLLDIEPDLGNLLSAEERQLAHRLTVPVRTLARQALDVEGLLEEAGAFAAVIVDGMILHRLALGDQPALRLLGAGDLLTAAGAMRSALLSDSVFRVTGQARIALLGDRVLAAGQRFPRLFASLQIRAGEQHQRLATQLAICQLPRVEDRLLALMWLLAESWGRVTPSGTVLPLSLTHDVLGEMIGARRPTVTLALKDLSDRGVLFRQDGVWLLLEPPPVGAPLPELRNPPELAVDAASRWVAAEDGELRVPPAEPQMSNERLVQIIAEMRTLHARHRREMAERIAEAQRVRSESAMLRQRLALDAAVRPRWRDSRPAPSA